MAEPTFGLVVLDSRLDDATLTDRGTAFGESDYDETGPEPGHPDTSLTWRPIALNAQSADANVRTVQSGYPGVDGASVAVGNSLVESEYLGWEDPVHVRGWTAPNGTSHDVAWQSAAGFDAVSLMRVPGREVLVVIATSSGEGPQAGGAWAYDPRNEAWWTVGADWTAVADGLATPVCAAWDPDAEQLLFWHGPGTVNARGRNWTAYSGNTTEFGASPTLYARGFLPVNAGDSPTAAGSLFYVAPSEGEDWLAFWSNQIAGTANRSIQYASSDQGVTWRQVTPTSYLTTGRDHQCVRVEGAFLVAYINSSDQPCVRLLPSAGSEFEQAAEIIVSASNLSDNVRAAVDDDGVAYLVARESTDTAIWRMYRSTDQGATWTEYNQRLTDGNTTAVFQCQDAQFCGGQLFLAGFWTTSSGTHDGSVGLLVLGGWTNVEADAGSDSYDRINRVGFGGTDPVLSREDPRAYFPADLPDFLGWIAIGSATVTLTPASGFPGLETLGTAAASKEYASPSGAPAQYRTSIIVSAQLTHTNGTEASAGVQSGGIKATALDDVTTPTEGWDVSVLVYNDALHLYDNVDSSVVASVAVDVPVDRAIFLRLYLRAPGLVSAWYRLEGEDLWQSIGIDVVVGADNIVTNSQGRFGVFGGAVCEITWQFVGVTGGAYGWQFDGVSSVFDDGTQGTRGLAFGRPVSAGGLRYPCPPLTTPAASVHTFNGFEEVGYLTGRGGPTDYDEVVSLPVAYLFGVANAFPSRVPSPRDPWKAGNTDEVALVFQPNAQGNDEAFYGDVVALLVLNANPSQWVLEVESATPATWDAVGTLDMRLGTGLTYDYTGFVLTPGSGTVAIDRYFAENELVGCYVDFAGDGVDVGVVTSNSAGYWSDRAGVQQVRLEMDGQGSPAASGSALVLHARSGLAVFALPGAVARSRVRVSASPGQPAPGGYQAGIVAVGRVLGVGADPAWPYRNQVELSRTLSRRTDQFLEYRRTGPARRVLTYDWPDGVILRDLRSEATAAEVAYSGGSAIGTEEDAFSVLTAVLVDRLNQGVNPCVVVPRLPALGDTLTDPRAFVYGRIRTDVHGVQGVTGTEGVDEVVRVDGITIEELR